MPAHLIDGKAIARSLRDLTSKRASEFTAHTGRPPGLATILVGDDPASEVYVRNKRRAAALAGVADFHRHLRASASEHEIGEAIDDLADDAAVSGILLQLPLPGSLAAESLIDRIPTAKDVDGLTTKSQGLLASGRPGLRPCTPAGVIELLDACGVDLRGARATVVGRSELVGRPMGQMLLRQNATVTLAHRHTTDLIECTRDADVLVVATGVPGLITAEHVKPGAVVIDVGITRTEDGLVGDVAFDEVRAVAGHLTPVPGGVGPMTIAMLLANTVTAAELAAGAQERVS